MEATGGVKLRHFSCFDSAPSQDSVLQSGWTMEDVSGTSFGSSSWWSMWTQTWRPAWTWKGLRPPLVEKVSPKWRPDSPDCSAALCLLLSATVCVSVCCPFWEFLWDVWWRSFWAKVQQGEPQEFSAAPDFLGPGFCCRSDVQVDSCSVHPNTHLLRGKKTAHSYI